QERSFHSLEDYIEAASMITDIYELSEYLLQNAIPVVADFPGQLFI
ncbi:3867_t:CDS:1, partial [Entrophospora sp. SA101]